MNIIQQLWQRIIESDNQPLLDKIYALQQTIEAEKNHNQELNSILSNTKQKYNKLEAENLLLEADNSLLTKQIEALMIKQQSKDKELEEYWNNKIKPTTSIKYSARDGKLMNIIDFFNKNNDKVPTMTGSSGDVLANNILKYVQKNVKYTKDIITSGRSEQWQWANETMATKTGDCFAGYEEIYTKEGLKKIETIKEGDEVLSYDFENQEFVYKPIIAFWSKGKLQVNRIHFRNGQHIDVSENHPMWVRTLQNKSVYDKQYLSDIDLARWWKRKVPIAKKIPYLKSQSLPIFEKELYIVIGHFIAEGWVDNYKVCSSGYELNEYIIPLLEKYEIPFSESKNNNGVPIINFLSSNLKDYLKSLKSNSFDIHLPQEIKTLPEEYLELLLYGMWLGDGTKYQCPDKRGYNNNREWTYSTSSKQLSEDIQEMGLYLGRTFHIWKQECHKGCGNKPIYRINYNPESHFLKDFGYKDISEVSISFIEKLDEVNMYDLTVADTHTVIMKNGIITHQCEDGAILMANMMLKSGIPYWRIRLNGGDVKGGGHAYVTYLREKDNKFYVLDWCYWPNESINFGQPWADAKNYFGIWFSWNKKYGFIKDTLDR